MKKRGKIEKLPRWKARVYRFNKHRLEWLEKIVKKAIPWLVLLLLFIIIGEFSGGINTLIAKMTGHETHFLHEVEEFFHHYHTPVLIIDQIIISFFVMDIYFNFFKSATFLRFLKRNFLDIIAVTPVGVFFRGSELAALAGVAEEVSLGQEVTHVATETEKVLVEGEKVAKEGERIAKIAEGEKAAKATRLTRTARTARIASRTPRLARLFRLRDFLKKKKHKNKKKR